MFDIIIPIASFLITTILFIFTVYFNIKKIKNENEEDGAEKQEIVLKLDALTKTTDMSSTKLSVIMDKVDNQNVKIAKIEQKLEDAKITDIQPRLSALEQSVKSAHKRLDQLEKKER